MRVNTMWIMNDWLNICRLTQLLRCFERSQSCEIRKLHGRWQWIENSQCTVFKISQWLILNTLIMCKHKWTFIWVIKKNKLKGLDWKGKWTGKLINKLSMYYMLAIQKNSDSVEKTRSHIVSQFINRQKTLTW